LIDDGLIPLVAQRFKALADPGRLAILASLQSGEKSVSELVEATGRGQPNVSQHLAGLARAGFVAARREGNRVFYRSTDPCIVEICDAVCRGLAARLREDQAWMKALRRGSRRPRGERG
jgi:DNA-binding transcriptional ArsR family regulator